jgi:hypothetical protein
MADPARRRATYDDLRDVPAHLVGEILNGDLVTSPRPAPPHAQAASSLSGELYAPFHKERDPQEWQGMLVNLTIRTHCDVSQNCGHGLACLDDKQCGPCSNDSDCVGGERCVLDHCLLADKVTCRTRADCRDQDLCMLSGRSPDQRGNSETTSFCGRPEALVRPQDAAVIQDDLRRAKAANPLSVPTPPLAPQQVALDYPELLGRLRPQRE